MRVEVSGSKLEPVSLTLVTPGSDEWQLEEKNVLAVQQHMRDLWRTTRRYIWRGFSYWSAIAELTGSSDHDSSGMYYGAAKKTLQDGLVLRIGACEAVLRSLNMSPPGSEITVIDAAAVDVYAAVMHGIRQLAAPSELPCDNVRRADRLAETRNFPDVDAWLGEIVYVRRQTGEGA